MLTLFDPERGHFFCLNYRNLDIAFENGKTGFKGYHQLILLDIILVQHSWLHETLTAICKTCDYNGSMIIMIYDSFSIVSNPFSHLWPPFPALLRYTIRALVQSIVSGEETKLDFNKIKEDLKSKDGGRKKLLLLQALRWVSRRYILVNTVCVVCLS